MPHTEVSAFPKRVLLVQCCHLPHFFYVAQQLLRFHNGWQLDALVVDDPGVRTNLERFPYFNEVYFTGDLTVSSRGYDKVIFPLLSRGYLKIKHQAGSVNSWNRICEVDYEGKLQSLKRIRLYLSSFQESPIPPEEFHDYQKEFPPYFGERVILVRSCHRSLVEATRHKWMPLLGDNTRLEECNVDTWLDFWKFSRSTRYDSAVVFFSGEQGFLPAKLLPFVLRLSRILVVNENGDYFFAKWSSLLGLFFRRVARGVNYPREDPKCVMLQTEDPRLLRHALEVLRNPGLYPLAKVLLVCREGDADFFKDLGDVELLTFSRQRGWRNFSLWRRIVDFDADLACAVFSGRDGFRKQKLAFFLLPVRRRLIFNGRSESYLLSLRTFPWIFRRDAKIGNPSGRLEATTLFLPTEEDSVALDTLRRLKDPKIVGASRVLVLCSEGKKALYESQPEVCRVISYQSGGIFVNMGIAWKLARMRIDVVAAILSGRSIFRLHKLFFLLIPARRRLAFNEHRDCRYVKRTSLGIFRLRHPGSSLGEVKAHRLLLKGALFLPRFLYLLIWLLLGIARKGGSKRLSGLKQRSFREIH